MATELVSSDRLATRGLDLVDDVLTGPGVAAAAVDRAADVVDDHERPPAGEEERMLTPQTATRAGDDRHLAVETEIRHRRSTPSLLLTHDTVAVSGPRTPCRGACKTRPVRAVRASGDGGVAVVDVEARAPEHATDPVRVRVRSCGICASDLHLAAWNLPVTLGHEFAGVLDDGTAVAVQPNAWCGACDRCLAGETQLCRHGASRLHGVSVDGGLADEVVVDRQLPRTARGRRGSRDRRPGRAAGGGRPRRGPCCGRIR